MSTHPSPSSQPATPLSHPSAESGLLLGTNWGWRRGLSHGLRQPSLLGEVWVQEAPSQRLQATVGRFRSWCGGTQPSENTSPAPSGLEVVHSLAFTVLHLQRELGIALDKSFSAWPSPSASDPAGWLRFQLLIPCPLPLVTFKILDWVRTELTPHAFAQHAPESVVSHLHQLLRTLIPKSLNSESIVDAALRLDIPSFSMPSGIQILGLGHQSKWLRSTLSHNSSALGFQIAQSKSLTASILRTSGLPGAIHRFVHSADDAVKAAHELGFPVVVKPDNLDRGTGVHADLQDEHSVRSAFDLARQHASKILVERYCPGFTHRISVFNRRIVRVSRRIAGGVTGDGRQTIEQLVRAEQGSAHQIHMSQHLGRMPIALDSEALDLLAQQQLTVKTIPKPGQYVRLRRRDNINSGGRNELIAVDRVHPDNIELSMTVADLLGLDFAGIDLIIEDITQSWRLSPSLICEVNAVPQLGTRSDPDCYLQILRDLFPQGWRIPCKLVIAPADAPSRKRLRDQLLRSEAGHGLSDHSGIFVAGQPVSRAFVDGLSAAQALLIRPDVTHAICLQSPEEILKMGTALSTWDMIDTAPLDMFSPTELSLVSAARKVLSLHPASDHPSNPTPA